jgi:type IV pilus assembly protein PilV
MQKTIKNRVRGLTLLEVLIALFILSIGLLGMAGLQLTGLRENQNAHFKTEAVLLAQDMADRMRSNPKGVADGRYNNIDSTEATYNKPSECATTDANCGEYIAKLDAYEWLNTGIATAIPNQLPLGEGQVANSNGVFTITVMWDDDRQGTGTNCAGAANENLRCITLEFVP